MQGIRVFIHVSVVHLDHSIHTTLPSQAVIQRVQIILCIGKEVHSLEMHGGTSNALIHLIPTPQQ